MDSLWSMTTTIREAERIPAFLKTAKEIENLRWDNDTQIKFQVLLIKNREYLNKDSTQTYNRLSNEHINILKNKDIAMSYEQAYDIFNAKKYEDPCMRGRQSMSPLEKLGLVDRSDGKIKITDVGNKLLNNEISFDEFMFEQLLKLQYPNMIEQEHLNWNSKPFINALRLIKKVNELCELNRLKKKGLTKIEFGIFALSIKNYLDVDTIAEKVISFRKKYESIKDKKNKKLYVSEYISKYLSNFKNPEKNIKEYTDNIIRYMRITKYTYIRGAFGNTCIDIEPRRMYEIESILKVDTGEAKKFSKEEWINYYGTYGQYKLPYETPEYLKNILKNIVDEINILENEIGMKQTSIMIPCEIEDLKLAIKQYREERTNLQNIKIKFDYSNSEKINEAIEALINIRKNDSPAIALEKWVNVALNIINDSYLIKPNSVVGDDNEPTFTAPAGIADIECFYDKFNAICEVTMLTNRTQWYSEGQPVMRHLRDFETKHPEKPSYCLFIAPSIHRDTLNTYHLSVKYEYEGKKQNIIPITIYQLIDILRIIISFKEKKIKFLHSYIENFYIDVLKSIENKNSLEWQDNIQILLNNWKNDISIYIS